MVHLYSYFTEMISWERLFRPDNEMLSVARKFVHRTYYNVVSYIHIPLVP